MLSNILEIKTTEEVQFLSEEVVLSRFFVPRRNISGIIPTEDSQFSSEDVVLSDTVI